MPDHPDAEAGAREIADGFLVYGPDDANARLEAAVLAALISAERRGAAVEREACLLAVDGERLIDNTGEPEDAAYNTAIDHALAAIRTRSSSPTGETKE